MSNKTRHIGKKIARQAAIQKIVSLDAQAAIKRRNKTIQRLNAIVDNPIVVGKNGVKGKKFSASKVLQAKKHLINIHAKSYATRNDITQTSSENDWRPVAVNPARK